MVTEISSHKTKSGNLHVTNMHGTRVFDRIQTYDSQTLEVALLEELRGGQNNATCNRTCKKCMVTIRDGLLEA